MFKRKIVYPSLSTGKKIIVILQLCFAFSLLLWYLFQPYMGDFFRIRSHQLLYDFVIGQGSSMSNTSKIMRNSERFKQLPESKQAEILNQYKELHTALNKSFFSKLESSLWFYANEIPLFKLAWIFFSIIISILLLKGRSGASQATWLLPIITLFNGIDNYTHVSNPAPKPDEDLFPNEQLIADRAVGEWKTEEERLRLGWNQYLIKEWSTPMSVNNDQASQLEEAEFNFTLARIERYQSSKIKPWLLPYNEKQDFATITLFFLWNLYFAVKMKRENN